VAKTQLFLSEITDITPGFSNSSRQYRDRGIGINVFMFQKSLRMSGKGIVGIVGSGLIGKSWAMIFASVGYEVCQYFC